MTEKLEPGLEQVEIKQTRTAPNPIRFNNATINKIRASQYNFGSKNFLFIPFDVSKDSHQRGLKLKIRRYFFFSIGLMESPQSIRLETTPKLLVLKSVMMLYLNFTKHIQIQRQDIGQKIRIKPGRMKKE